MAKFVVLEYLVINPSLSCTCRLNLWLSVSLATGPVHKPRPRRPET